MKLIPLTQGKFAMVDDEDFDRVRQFNWQAQRQKNNWYAGRAIPASGVKKQTRQALHRFLLPGIKGIDHIDMNGLNNQKNNLRPATHTQNNANSRKRLGKSSRFVGVYWHSPRGYWRASFKIRGHQFLVGYFDSEEDAAISYDWVAELFHGEFARPNFPE